MYHNGSANRGAACEEKTENTADRASLQFPASVEMPEDVVWKRDVYRQLDLTLDKNAPLYYPVEPMSGKVNLFTYLFDLLLTGKFPPMSTNWVVTRPSLPVIR